MHASRPLRAALALVLVIVVAACSQPAVVDTRVVVSGTATGPAELQPLGVAFLMIDEVGLTALSLSERSAFLEAAPGVFVDPVVPVGADGAFSLTLPDVDDVPSTTFVDVADFYLNLTWGDPACTLIVSDPAAQVSLTAFELVTLPGFVAYTLDGSALATLSTEPIDFGALAGIEDLFGIPFVTWIAADRDVEVSGDAACDADGLGIDLALRAGWNQVTFTLDADGYSLTNDDGDEFFLSIAFF